MAREVVITGAAMTTPLGQDLAAQVARCYAGEAAFRAITLYETAGSHVRFAGEHAAPDPKELPDRKFAKVLNRRDQTSVVTSVKAVRAACLAGGEVPAHRLGMYVGVSSTHLGDLTPYGTLASKCADLARGTFDSRRFGAGVMEDFNPLVVLKLLMNNALCYGTIGLGIKGPNSNYMQYEVAGLRAIGEGALAIAEDKADVVVAGGAAAQVEPFQMHEAYHLGLLADQRAPGFDPGLAVRPYDELCSGTVLSEGAAYVVLEAAEHARARGAPVLARVTGFGLAADGGPDEEMTGASPGLAQALTRATAAAGIGIGELHGILGDGRGQALADRIEGLTYVELFGDRQPPLASLKGQLGELCEAAGAAATVVGLAALARRALPPTKNFHAAALALRALKLAATPQTLAGTRLAVVSRSRFGVAAALILEGA